MAFSAKICTNFYKNIFMIGVFFFKNESNQIFNQLKQSYKICILQVQTLYEIFDTPFTTKHSMHEKNLAFDFEFLKRQIFLH